MSVRLIVAEVLFLLSFAFVWKVCMRHSGSGSLGVRPHHPLVLSFFLSFWIASVGKLLTLSTRLGSVTWSGWFRIGGLPSGSNWLIIKLNIRIYKKWSSFRKRPCFTVNQVWPGKPSLILWESRSSLIFMTDSCKIWPRSSGWASSQSTTQGFKLWF